MDTHTILYLAIYESRNFEWQGVGFTPAAAEAALIANWNEHAKYVGGMLKWSDYVKKEYGTCSPDFMRVKLEVGRGYKDWN